jgi:hypothetical protein
VFVRILKTVLSVECVDVSENMSDFVSSDNFEDVPMANIPSTLVRVIPQAQIIGICNLQRYEHNLYTG